MLRKIALALPVLMLAGCEEPKPSPGDARLIQACEAGDTNACIAYEQIRAQRIAAVSAYLGARQPVQLQHTPMPVSTPVRTNCTTTLGQTNCTTY
ncbi:hypothetical protein [Leisingera sp. ANG-M7]|uniref:hypothetical protein n=1 Tax=Leisingera sp. ANG-M7 TaxID=1577902 RepID=UPI00057F81D2|nr:hypothetical protein [Leisingera sp. ANG-M7]KIC39376.1 hypothetical protein RA26_01620 [Leisingera sp. ANG-M7]